jgi:hypothetical protein
MADLFCRTARRRVKGLFRSLWSNDDPERRRVAADVLAGRHAWLEAGSLGRRTGVGATAEREDTAVGVP